MMTDKQPGDFCELELRIGEQQRKIIQRMFISEIEQQKMVEKSLGHVMNSIDIEIIIRREAEYCVQEAIKSYFKYGRGADFVKSEIGKVLDASLKENPNPSIEAPGK